MTSDAKLHSLAKAALKEDAAFDDVTCRATIPTDRQGSARITAKADGVLSGVRAATAVFETMDAGIAQRWRRSDGDTLHAGEVVCELAGSMRSLLAAERTALNFLQHLSGIATLTRRFVSAVAGSGCAIVDTRKTTPGLRRLEKLAVVHGGGVNHRMDLAAGILIKENHIAAAGSITDAIAACRRQAGSDWIEVECETLAQVAEAVAARPDIILLDNMAVHDVKRARAVVPRQIALEASGTISLDTVRAYAETGVDRLAVGCITHSAPALDLSMRVTE